MTREESEWRLEVNDGEVECRGRGDLGRVKK